jgi:mttA/Hcf106 family
VSLGPAEILVLLVVVLVFVGPRRLPEAARHLRRALGFLAVDPTKATAPSPPLPLRLRRAPLPVHRGRECRIGATAAPAGSA